MAKEKEYICGTYSCYTRGCRCTACKQARYEYRKNYRFETSVGGFGDELLSTQPIMDFVGDMSFETLAEILGLTKDCIRGWNSRPRKIHRFLADEYAYKLGVHPSYIWGKDWWSIPFKSTKTEKGMKHATR